LVPDLDLQDEAYSAAVQDVSDRLVHELRKIVGRARLYARRECGESSSKTTGELERLQDFIQGIETLGNAASAPRLEEFDLAQVAVDEIQVHLDDPAATDAMPPRIELHGRAPFFVVADVSLVRMALANALKNAIEATKDAGSTAAVVVTWESTDRDVWLAVLDRGIGPPLGREQLFEVGSSTKPGHLGLGLALAKQGLTSLGGSVELNRSEAGVTRFEARWPLYGEQ
jgi:signal transduction histidine kinase